MSVSRRFDQPYFTGTSSSITAAGTTPFDVVINGRGYLLDLVNPAAPPFGFKSIPMLQAMFLQDRGTIPIGEHCVDEETEILTSRGWLTCDQVEPGDQAWTLDVDARLARWEPISEVFRYEAKPRTMVSLEFRSHSSLTTRDHRWPVDYKAQGGLPPYHRSRFHTTAELTGNDSFIVAAPAGEDQEPKYSDAFAELVGWFWAEGSVTYSNHGNTGHPRRLEISQSRTRNPAKVARIRALCHRLMGSQFNEYENPNGCTHFQFHPDALPELLEVMVRTRPFKAVYPEFVNALTQAQLRLFLDGCFLGDGYWNGSGHKITQKYRRGLDAIQMAAVLAGYRTSATSIRCNDFKGWAVQYNDKTFLNNVVEMDRTEVAYEGRVWCVATPSQTWMARRRGRTYFTGNSLSPHDYWRRSVDDWSAGAGQLNLDHTDSANNRYRTSKGIDPWTPGQIGMLPDTARKLTSANTNLALSVAGTYLYVLDGTAWKYTQDVTVTTPTMTSLTATGGDAALSGAVEMTTDGYTVWVADATRVHYTTKGSANFAKFHAADHVCTLIRSAKGRLFSAAANVLYTHTLTAGTAVVTPYFTHANADWTWTSITGGPDSVYFAGYSGGVSYIYAATIKTDGTALDAPVVVATMPQGEIVRSMRAYLSVLVIGTDKGFRIASIGGTAGQLVLGSAVAMAAAPKSFETQDRFVWFGWSNYDTSSTGLGRIDLSTFNGDTPAYASDLMATAQGNVTSVVTFQNLRLFTVSGSGLWGQTTNKVPSAQMTQGSVNYALSDPKLAIKLVTQYRVGAGTIVAALAADDRAAVNVGNPIVTSAAAGNSATINLPQVEAQNFEVSYTLTRSAADPTQGPSIDRFTLMVEPAPERRVQIIAPLLLHSVVIDHMDDEKFFNPAAERARFTNLMQSREIVSFQDADESYSVLVDDLDWVPYQLIHQGQRATWDGTLVVTLKLLT